MPFSIVIPVYTPQHPKGSDFSTSLPILVFSVFESGHPNYCGVASYFSFDLCFPND